MCCRNDRDKFTSHIWTTFLKMYLYIIITYTVALNFSRSGSLMRKVVDFFWNKSRSMKINEMSLMMMRNEYRI